MSIVLSCPSCSTRYRANPQAIGENGRRVRCASCNHTWTAELEDPASLPDIEPVAVETEVVEEPVIEEEPAKPHEVFREREAAKRRTMSAAVAGGAWGGLVAVCGLLFLTAWIFRVDVVTLWPQASSAYATMGAEVNPYGYSVSELNITRESEHGVPLVVIEGHVHNFDYKSHPVPDLRAILKDENGESLLEWAIPITGGSVSAGERREFRTIVSDPPPQSVEAEVMLVAATSLDEIHDASAEPDHSASDVEDHSGAEVHDEAAADDHQDDHH